MIFFDGRNKSLPSGGNVLYLFFCLELIQPSNFDHRWLMDLYWYLNPCKKKCGSFIGTNSLIIWEYFSEQYLSSLEKYWGSYKSILLLINSIRDSILLMVLSTFSHIYIDSGLLIDIFFASNDQLCFIEAEGPVLFLGCTWFDQQ